MAILGSAHLHLLVNHIPVIGSVFGLIVLVIALLRRSTGLKLVAFWTLAICGLAAIPVFYTGEPAEHDLFNFATDMQRDLIGDHKNAALISTWFAAFTGVFGVAGLVLNREWNTPAWLGKARIGATYGTLGLAIVTVALMRWTATLGGEINHPEIRPDREAYQLEESLSGSGSGSGSGSVSG